MATPLERYEHYAARVDRIGAARARRVYWNFIAAVVILAFVVAAASFVSQVVYRQDVRGATFQSDVHETAVEESVYYPNCSAARAAGAAPISEGEPGYRPGLDGDSDGIACEPYYPHMKR